MKRILIFFGVFLFYYSIGLAQPNSKTTVEVGIVNPQPNKIYTVFGEVKADTSTSRLIDGMDYNNPDVTDLIQTLNNIHNEADTLLGEIEVQDVTNQRFFKAGLVQTDSTTTKYSAMTTTYWLPLDRIEELSAGFFIRKIKK